MADVLANAIGIITGTLLTTKAIKQVVETIKDTPQQIRHLQEICVLVNVNLTQIRDILEQKRMHQVQIQTQQIYYDSISKVVRSMGDDLNAIEKSIPSRDEVVPRNIKDRLFKSRALNALQLKFNLNEGALQRIDRSIRVLHWTTTSLWDYEQVPPHSFNNDFQNNLREFFRRLGNEENIYRENHAGPSIAANDQKRLENLEVFKACAFGIANNLASQSLSSERNTPARLNSNPSFDNVEGLSSMQDLERVHPLELRYRYEDALAMVDRAKEQQFPDVAAEFQEQVVEYRAQMNRTDNNPVEFLVQFRLKCRHVALLLASLNWQNRERGRVSLEELASDLEESAVSLRSTKRFLKAAQKEVGNLYYELAEWNLAIRYLRGALPEGDFSTNNHNKDDILRLSRMICTAYEASMDRAKLKAFRRRIHDWIGVDPGSDPSRFRAALEWSRNNGFLVDTSSDMPSFIGVKDEYGDSPLHKAICDSDIDPSVLRQLSQDPDALNATGKQELTPLLIAVEHANIQAVTALLDEGASLDIRKPRGDFSDTVLHCCSDPTILELLIAKLGTRQSNTAASSDTEQCENTVSLPLHIDTMNDLGSTALLDACDRNDFPSAKVLLENGADPNGRNHSDETPLIVVSYNKKNKADTKRIVEELMLYQADPIQRDKIGRHASEGLRKRGFTKTETDLLLSKTHQGRGSSTGAPTSGPTSLSPFCPHRDSSGGT